MAAPSSAILLDGKDEELKNYQINQPLRHSPGEGVSPVTASSPPGSVASQRRRNHWGNPSPDAEVIALSPKTLMATSQFFCEVCNRGFQREQNLQLHLRGHNLPWKLKKKTTREVKKKVYVCPELNCLHHDRSRALGDLTGTKKHFSRKHGTEKQFSCDKCNERYAVHLTGRLTIRSVVQRSSYVNVDLPSLAVIVLPITAHSVMHLQKRWQGTPQIPPPHSRMASSILTNTSNPGSMRLGPAASSLIQGATSPISFTSTLLSANHQQLSTPLVGQGASSPNSFTSLLSGQSTESSFQPILSFLSNTAPSSMFNIGFSGSADLNSPQNDLDLNITNSFSGLMMNAETSPHKIMNSKLPSPQLSATALPQKASLLTGANSNNAASLMKGMESSLSGAMKFYSYEGASGDGMRAGGGRWGGSALQQNGSYGRAGKYGGGTEYWSDQMNAPYDGMMYNVNSVDEVNTNVVVEPHMNVRSEYSDKFTRDFLGGMVGDHNENGTETNLPDTQATPSAETRPFVPSHCRGFKSINASGLLAFCRRS